MTSVRTSGVFVAFLAVAIVSAVLPASIGPVVGFWAMLGACVTPLVFGWLDVRGRRAAYANGSGQSADAARRRQPVSASATDATVTEGRRTIFADGTAGLRVRLCSAAGLGLASLGWVLFVVGKMRMDILRAGSLSFAAYSDWGFDLVRLALVLGVLASVTLLGARGRTRLRGLTSAALLVIWTFTQGNS